MTVVAEDDGADLVLFEVQREAVSLMRKLEQLAGHRVLQTVNLRDAVTGRDDAPDIRRNQARVEILEPLLDYIRNLFGIDWHSSSPKKLPPVGGAIAAIGWRHSRRRGGRRTGASARPGLRDRPRAGG